MAFSLTPDEYLRAVARETARMSWPGQMAPILKPCAKKTTGEYFVSAFFVHLKRIWQGKQISDYDKWHAQRVDELAASLKRKVKGHNRRGVLTHYRAQAVAARILNPFMHQLMKYERGRFLWGDLHLPLDQRIFAASRKLAARDAAFQNPGFRKIIQ